MKLALDYNYRTDVNVPEDFINTNKDFIGIWDNIFFDDFCQFLINFFNQSSIISPRNTSVKQDNQITLSTFDDYSNDHLMFGVQQCLNNYRTWYPYLSNYTFYSSQNLIHKTEPSQGYHTFHSEDDSLNAINRTLAWMVYLNDVDEGGETEFLYQQIKVIPKRGRVVIWPGTFTHLHRGNPPFTTKYIATGWLCYNPKNAMITGY